MSACLQFFTEDFTLLGLTFQNWMPVVTGIFIVWVSGSYQNPYGGGFTAFSSLYLSYLRSQTVIMCHLPPEHPR